MRYQVYTISHRGIVRYVGMTGNKEKRQKAHNALFRNGYKKELYNFLREQKFKGEMELVTVYECKKKVDAKRMEMYLVLQDYFGNKNLKQKVPSIGR